MQREKMEALLLDAAARAEKIERARKDSPNAFGSVVREQVEGFFALVVDEKDIRKLTERLFSCGVARLADAFLMAANARFVVSMQTVQRYVDCIGLSDQEAKRFLLLVRDMCETGGLGFLDGDRPWISKTPDKERRYAFILPATCGVKVSVPGENFGDAAARLCREKDPLRSFPGVIYAESLDWTGDALGFGHPCIQQAVGLSDGTPAENAMGALGGHLSPLPPLLGEHGPKYGQGQAFRADIGHLCPPPGFDDEAYPGYRGRHPVISLFAVPTIGGPFDLDGPGCRLCVYTVCDAHPFAYGVYHEFVGDMAGMLSMVACWADDYGPLGETFLIDAYMGLLRDLSREYRLTGKGILDAFMGTGDSLDDTRKAVERHMLLPDFGFVGLPAQLCGGLAFKPVRKQVDGGTVFAEGDPAVNDGWDSVPAVLVGDDGSVIRGAVDGEGRFQKVNPTTERQGRVSDSVTKDLLEVLGRRFLERRM